MRYRPLLAAALVLLVTGCAARNLPVSVERETTMRNSPLKKTPGTANIIGMDGASIIGMDGANIIGMDGASIIGNDTGSLESKQTVATSRPGEVNMSAPSMPEPGLPPPANLGDPKNVITEGPNQPLRQPITAACTALIDQTATRGKVVSATKTGDWVISFVAATVSGAPLKGITWTATVGKLSNPAGPTTQWTLPAKAGSYDLTATFDFGGDGKQTATWTVTGNPVAETGSWTFTGAEVPVFACN